MINNNNSSSNTHRRRRVVDIAASRWWEPEAQPNCYSVNWLELVPVCCADYRSKFATCRCRLFRQRPRLRLVADTLVLAAAENGLDQPIGPVRATGLNVHVDTRLQLSQQHLQWWTNLLLSSPGAFRLFVQGIGSRPVPARIAKPLRRLVRATSSLQPVTSSSSNSNRMMETNHCSLLTIWRRVIMQRSRHLRVHLPEGDEGDTITVEAARPIIVRTRRSVGQDRTILLRSSSNQHRWRS